ncbi:MAG: peptidylprolyl isomerase, partial [Pseudomonadota bacterium]
VSSVHVQHILIKLPEHPSPQEVAKAREKAGEIVARARSGEPFADLARAYSEDESTREQTGDLGWFKRSELPTEWEEIVFGMAAGEVRGPTRGPKGLHVFRMADTRRESMRPFDEVKEQLRNQLFNEELEKQSRLWLEELRKKAHVEIKL